MAGHAIAARAAIARRTRLAASQAEKSTAVACFTRQLTEHTGTDAALPRKLSGDIAERCPYLLSLRDTIMRLRSMAVSEEGSRRICAFARRRDAG